MMADPLRQAQEAANVFADTADKMGEVIVRLEAENARLRMSLGEFMFMFSSEEAKSDEMELLFHNARAALHTSKADG
jgi:hypothetical protein